MTSPSTTSLVATPCVVLWLCYAMPGTDVGCPVARRRRPGPGGRTVSERVEPREASVTRK
eukprot:636500-Rhodomonas_salina.1